MPTNEITLGINLSHEEMAAVRGFVVASYVPDQRHIARKMDNGECFALWVTLKLQSQEKEGDHV